MPRQRCTPGDGVEGGGLAGAVRADQADDRRRRRPSRLDVTNRVRAPRTGRPGAALRARPLRVLLLWRALGERADGVHELDVVPAAGRLVGAGVADRHGEPVGEERERADDRQREAEQAAGDQVRAPAPRRAPSWRRRPSRARSPAIPAAISAAATLSRKRGWPRIDRRPSSRRCSSAPSASRASRSSGGGPPVEHLEPLGCGHGSSQAQGSVWSAVRTARRRRRGGRR